MVTPFWYLCYITKIFNPIINALDMKTQLVIEMASIASRFVPNRHSPLDVDR